MTASIKERVMAGAALLDQRLPGWHDRIDTTVLIMDSGSRCVLGQLFGGRYSVGVTKLFSLVPFIGNMAAEHGFEPDFDADLAEYDKLDAAWRASIEERRAGGAS